MQRAGSRTAGLLVWVVAFGSFAAQMVFTSPSRAWSWDEAIYLSQVTPGSPALPFVASRARGITLMVAPLTAIGAPGWVIRIALAAASSLVLALVFRLWVPSVGMAAPIGAVLFAASWQVLFYGSEVMPNLWSALFAVGIVGCLVRLVGDEDGSRSLMVGSAVTAALMALVRPPDALVLAVALAAAVLVLQRARWRALLPLALGVFIGWTPWALEMSVRFGGPISALRRAQDLSHLAGSGTGFRQYLQLTDGPLLGPDPNGAVPLYGALWWCGLALMVVLALVWDRRGARASAARFAAVGGIALAVEYVVLVSGLAPRFLLPSLALLSLAAGCGLDTLRRRGALGRATAGVAVLAIAAGAIWQVETLRRLETHARAERRGPTAAGEAIARNLDRDGRPCLAISSDDYPQVAFAAGCRGAAAPPSEGSIIAGAGGGVVVRVSREPLVGHLLPGLPSSWYAVRLDPS